MAEPYSDEELLAYVDRQGLDAACQHYRYLGNMIRRLQRERDAAIADARFLADCACKLNDGDQLIEHAVDAGLTALRERLDGLFSATQLEQVVARYPEVPHG